MHEPRSRYDGVLYRLNTDLSCTAMADKVMVSNGLAFSLMEKLCIGLIVETERYFLLILILRMVKYQIAEFFETSEEQGRPDGATIDAEGYYWSACFMGGRILRISPEGILEREIFVPVKNVTMVCFWWREFGHTFHNHWE